MSYYGEDWRHYHTLRHLYSCFEILGEFEDDKFSEDEKAIVYLTLFFHDIIYVPWRKDNEEV